MSGVVVYFNLVFFDIFGGYKVVDFVGGGYVINGATLPSFFTDGVAPPTRSTSLSNFSSSF